MRLLKTFSIFLILTGITMAETNDTARYFLIGYDSAVIKEPGKLLTAISYVTQRMNGGCMQILGRNYLETMNHLWDHPRSKKYFGFSAVAFRQDHKDNVACDADIARAFQDFKVYGMDVVALAARPIVNAAVKKQIPVSEKNLLCEQFNPRRPGVISFNIGGTHYWTNNQGCAGVKEALEKAAKNSGTLEATLETKTLEAIEFTNDGHGADVALYWKKKTTEHESINFEGLQFDRADTKIEIINHD